MLMYQVILEKSAQKDLIKIDKRYRNRILKVIYSLRESPFLGKPLLGELRGYHSLRVWPYRIIYKIKKEKLMIFVLSENQ